MNNQLPPSRLISTTTYQELRNATLRAAEKGPAEEKKNGFGRGWRVFKDSAAGQRTNVASCMDADEQSTGAAHGREQMDG
jgi:hypothetical protein